ncbi:hypothetical protein [Bradyrhizobium genosp. A]|uniref:hypothetical protein n=1 Tax=Bradyrhizobium genosp. A TaxID=83626 RepID=UPI003CEF0865
MSPNVDMRLSGAKIPNLWAWLRSSLPTRVGGTRNQLSGSELPALVTATKLDPDAGSATPENRSAPFHSPKGASAEGGVILPFPICGEAVLLKLAEVLRKVFSGRDLAGDPPLLILERSPEPRLWIDRTAHVEFHPGRREYRAIIETSPDTRIIVETFDFDALIDFVLQYVIARLVGHAALEVTP